MLRRENQKEATSPSKSLPFEPDGEMPFKPFSTIKKEDRTSSISSTDRRDSEADTEHNPETPITIAHLLCEKEQTDLIISQIMPPAAYKNKIAPLVLIQDYINSELEGTPLLPTFFITQQKGKLFLNLPFDTAQSVVDNFIAQICDILNPRTSPTLPLDNSPTKVGLPQNIVQKEPKTNLRTTFADKPLTPASPIFNL